MPRMDLREPCGGDAPCPFRTDCLDGWLGRARAAQIARDVFEDDKSFSCHKTTRSGGAPRGTQEQHCAGALILAERLGKPNQWMRWMERLGLYDHSKLHMDAPVFPTVAAFIEHHGRRA